MRTRTPRLVRLAAVPPVVAVLALAACDSDDDGSDVRNLATTVPGGTGATGSGSASASASGSGSATAAASGSGSGSATGIVTDSLAEGGDNPLLVQAVDGYRDYVGEQVDTMIAETTVFTAAVRAGDIEAAKAAYPISRRSWERIEPIAGLIEDVDTAVDAREDDYDGPTDEEFTGWHRLEYQLWDAEDISEAGPIADQLDADLAGLREALPALELPAGVLTVGAQELIEEVAAPDGKLSGEEDRYSGTDLYDFQANVEGSEALVELLAPALEEADPELLATIRGQFAALYDHLAELGSFEQGFVHYDEVTDEQKAALADDLGALAESLSLLNGTLGLE